MIFTETPLAGAYLIDVEAHPDMRGLFARTVADDEFAVHGLSASFVHQSVSWNRQRGTLRGLHFQAAPFGEDKLVRVTRGALFDVIVDLRPGSASYGRWHGVDLSAENRRQLYIPEGFAHGFQTTEPETEIFYQMTVPFRPEAARGICWNDETLAIAWPLPQSVVISKKDQALPPLAGQAA